MNSSWVRSTTSLTRSRLLGRQPKLHWWQRRPILKNAIFCNLQTGSYIAAIYSIIESLLQLSLALFDVYCLIEASPGSRHFRSYGINFLFVYSGNQHVRRLLIAFSLFLILFGLYLLIASFILLRALRNEDEHKFHHWLQAMSVFTIVRFFSLIFASIVNDLYFAYHQSQLILWTLLMLLNLFAILVTLSNYQELVEITRLEDVAALKMPAISSRNSRRSLSQSMHSLASTAGSHTYQAVPHRERSPSPQPLTRSTGNLSSEHQTKPKTLARGAGTSRANSQASLHQAFLQAFTETLASQSASRSASTANLGRMAAQSQGALSEQTFLV